MRRAGLALLAAALLAGCGADGPPVRPEPEEDPPAASGVTLSGSASMGVSGGSRGGTGLY